MILVEIDEYVKSKVTMPDITDSTDLISLSKSLTKQLGEDVLVEREGDKIIVRRLLID